MPANLASQSDAIAYGYGAIDETLFTRASARVRSYVRQEITSGESTITVRGPIVLLPERPVTQIVSIVDYETDPDNPHTLTSREYSLRPGGVLQVPKFGGNLDITYRHGFSVVPAEVVELVCAVASRLAQVNPAAAAGVQQETGGSESVSYGFDSYNAISELSTGEKRVLDRLFPKRANVVVMRA